MVSPFLLPGQQQEILHRAKAFTDGNTSSRSWDEIKAELQMFIVELLTEVEVELYEAVNGTKKNRRDLVKDFLTKLISI